MTHAEAIEKIKKLLRMKRGGTQGEIENALEMAARIAREHGIELDDVNPDDEQQRERPITHADEILGARVQWECKYAMLVAQEFFNVSFYQTITADRWKYCFRVVGTEWDIQIAIYVYRFLVGHFRREWKQRRGRCRNRQAFMYGMYCGLWRKLLDRQPQPVQEPGLVTTDHALARRKDYIAKIAPDLASTKIIPDGDAEKAKWLGYLAGKDTEIRSGVNGGADGAEELPTTGERRLLA